MINQKITTVIVNIYADITFQIDNSLAIKAKDLKCIVMRQHVKQYHYTCIKFKACQNNLTSRGCKIII